jgi:large conductance mechanosensitive channel
MSLAKEFKEFALKGNVIDLAVAVVIGGAFGKIVTALVEDIIMPLVGRLLPGQDWKSFQAGGLKIGDFAGTVVDFFIVAVVLFVVVIKVMGAFKKKTPVVETTKKCRECLETIPLEARRCRACTAPQMTSL